MINWIKVQAVRFYLAISILRLKAKFWVKNNLKAVWARTPWYRAHLLSAYAYYFETPMYRERIKHFGEYFAYEHFIDNDESRLFMKLVRRDNPKLMWKIAFVPYLVIHQNMTYLPKQEILCAVSEKYNEEEINANL